MNTPTDNPCPTLVITGWSSTFENADTRKRQRLKSFHCPSGLDSRGLVNLLCHFEADAALAAFGVFQLICQLSATLPADHRGRLLHSDGSPMTLEFLARLLRVPICHLHAALEILQDQRVAWISWDGISNDLPVICQSSPGFVQGEGEGEGEGSKHHKGDDPSTPPAKDAVPTLDEVLRVAKSSAIGISEDCARAFYDQQELQGWITNQGFPIANWQAALRRWASKWNANEVRRPALNASRGPEPQHAGTGYREQIPLD